MSDYTRRPEVKGNASDFAFKLSLKDIKSQENLINSKSTRVSSYMMCDLTPRFPLRQKRTFALEK